MLAPATHRSHTHPSVPWFRTKEESSYFTGQVKATVHVELPTWVELLLHNITVHGAHHVDPRIPFRDLPTAQRRLESSFSEDIIVERWSLASFVAVTRSCKLYDYDRGCWLDFAGRETSTPASAGALQNLTTDAEAASK